MVDTTLKVKDADGITQGLLASEGDLGVLTPYHKEDTTQRAALLAAINLLATETTLGDVLTALSGLATQTTAAAILAKLSSDPATQTTLAAVLAKLSSDPSTATLQGVTNTTLGTLATQTTAAAILAKLTADPSTATLQSANTSAVNQVGTRTYAAPITRVAVGASSVQSAAITGTEVAVCFVGTAGTFVYIAAGSNPTATTDGIPLVAGALFHMRITSGHKVAVIRDGSSSGYVNVIPVA